MLMQSKLDQCESGNQEAVIAKKELDSCRRELSAVQTSERKLSHDLRTAKKNYRTLKDKKEVLYNQLNLEKTESENLRNRIRQLEIENDELHNQLNSLKPQKSRIQLLGQLPGGIDLWHGNFVQGEYVIAYELDSGLHQSVKTMLPKVYSRFRVEFKPDELSVSGRAGQLIRRVMVHH